MLLIRMGFPRFLKAVIHPFPSKCLLYACNARVWRFGSKHETRFRHLRSLHSSFKEQIIITNKPQYYNGDKCTRAHENKSGNLMEG